MKKLVLGTLFSSALMFTIAIGFTSVETAEASQSRTGKWIDVYGGGSQPSGAYCSATAWRSQCMSGDTKSYSLEIAP